MPKLFVGSVLGLVVMWIVLNILKMFDLKTISTVLFYAIGIIATILLIVVIVSFIKTIKGEKRK